MHVALKNSKDQLTIEVDR